LIVTASTPIFTVDGQPLGEIQPGDAYEVVLVEDGWALVAFDVESLYWIELGAGVDLVGVGEDESA
jgi:hypothetical protein